MLQSAFSKFQSKKTKFCERYGLETAFADQLLAALGFIALLPVVALVIYPLLCFLLWYALAVVYFGAVIRYLSKETFESGVESLRDLCKYAAKAVCKRRDHKPESAAAAATPFQKPSSPTS